ncbi:MAG: polysaccharide deacetylase family protein [Oscillospiraceae bacterium]|nr:polysaccharide deacetylase family protein [Oscillospiraceae bacterium]
MFTYTTSRKKLLRTIIIVLAALAGAGIILAAVMSSMKVSAASRKLPIYSVSRGDNKIALTFDCAWGNSNTDLLLSLLKEADAKATFFVTGEFCDKYPEDVRKMYEAGHEIGNHSDAHPHVEGININDLIADTRECSRKIKMITGEEPALYRAPYGEYDDNVVATIEGMGLSMIQWSVDSIDWQEPDPDTIIDRITKGTQSGSILLFHNDLENTAEALPQLLTALRQKGFTFSRVSDMVYKENYHIDSSGAQIYDHSALIPTAAYSDDPLINESMKILRQNMSLQELYDLTGGVTQDMADRVEALLNEEQIAALQEASFETLKEAFTNLIAAVEQEQGVTPSDTTPFYEGYSNDPDPVSPESSDSPEGASPDNIPDSTTTTPITSYVPK